MWTEQRWKKLGKAVRALIFTAGFVCLFLSLTKLMQYKAAITRMEPFFEIEEPIDVMFFGTSHVTNGILPYELWGSYGISSYNFGSNAARIPLTYWKVMNAFDYQVPKLVVMDCSYLSSDSKLCTTLQQSHNILDAFPLSKTKRAAINDLFEEENKLEFLWPFSVYHNRWDELKKSDFVIAYNDGLGAAPSYNVAVPASFEQLPEGTGVSHETVAMEYIGKLIASCRERGVEILLTYLPCPANAKRQKEANSMVELAEKYGVNCINFLDLPDVVDFSTDCNDADSHLNASGAKKITEYLGSYIREHYDIPDHRAERNFSDWKKKYASYVYNKIEMLENQKLLSSYLLLLADRDLHSLVYVREGSAVLRDARLAGLLENIRQHGNQSKVQILSPEDFAAACGDGADLVAQVSRVDTGGHVSSARFVVKSELPIVVNRTE